MPIRKTYIVEHLDPELGPWSELEYVAIARETGRAGGAFVLSSLPPALAAGLPGKLTAEPAFRAETRGVEELYPVAAGGDGGAAATEVGDRKRVCLLDPRAEKDINPDDKALFDVFLFGGILGDDPPRDRTGELRVKGFEGRRLGPVQMTTDTAVRVTRMVIDEQFTLGMIPYVDYPDLQIDEHESTEMPFRYVKGDDGKPIMPEVFKGMMDLIKKDADKSINDLF